MIETKKKQADSVGVRAADFIAEFRSDPENDRLFLESEIRFNLSERMKELRKSRGLSQVALAERVGCKQPFIAKLEKGAYDRVGLSTIRTYARAMGYDVSLDGLFLDISDARYTGKSSCEDLEEALQLQGMLSGRLATLTIASWTKNELNYEKTLEMGRDASLAESDAAA
jgi:transcriptional regulator with XRE-family HTH domain